MPQPNQKGLFPQPPAPPTRERAPVDRPRSMDTAFQLTFMAIVVAVLGTVVNVLVDPASVTRTSTKYFVESRRRQGRRRMPTVSAR